MKIIVALDGSGQFTSIQEAINNINSSIQEKVVIYIKKGVYKEKICVEKPHIHLMGENVNETIIFYDDYAEKVHEDGRTYGTFRSYSIFIGANDFSAENITFINSAGYGKRIGQALACYVDGDRIIFRNCRLKGRQDTLFTGPLPPQPIEPGSFKGPREQHKRINGRHYYESCYIEGDIDFIFGSATAYFYQCEIFSCNRNKEVNGFVTAASTPEGQAYGYVFESCKLTSDCQLHTVYLGRPWRDFAHTAFIRCELGAHIKDEGWDNWGKTHAEQTIRYEEYKNFGIGAQAKKRVSWSKQLTQEEASQYTIENILGGEDKWNPRMK